MIIWIVFSILESKGTIFTNGDSFSRFIKDMKIIGICQFLAVIIQHLVRKPKEKSTKLDFLGMLCLLGIIGSIAGTFGLI